MTRSRVFAYTESRHIMILGTLTRPGSSSHTATMHEEDNMFDKVKAAITSAKTSVNDAVNEEIKARRFNALKALAGVDTKLTKAEEQLETAVKRSAPRVKKTKKTKTPKA